MSVVWSVLILAVLKVVGNRPELREVLIRVVRKGRMSSFFLGDTGNGPLSGRLALALSRMHPLPDSVTTPWCLRWSYQCIGSKALL